MSGTELKTADCSAAALCSYEEARPCPRVGRASKTHGHDAVGAMVAASVGAAVGAIVGEQSNYCYA